MTESNPGAKRFTVLVVEDEPLVRELLADNLEYEGYAVCSAPDLATARRLRASSPDLVIFDVNLPDGDGIAELTAWRESGFIAPVIVCTVKDREIDVIRALDAGADDYVTKPFRIREFLSRVKAVLRRSAAACPPGRDIASPDPGRVHCHGPVCFGPCSVDFSAREVSVDGVAASLTATEWNILEYLYRNRNIVVSREQIIEHIWGIRDLEDSRAVDVHLGRLRRKLREKDPPEFVVTVRGLGYRLAI